jgi:hypothetical protein
MLAFERRRKSVTADLRTMMAPISGNPEIGAASQK